MHIFCVRPFSRILPGVAVSAALISVFAAFAGAQSGQSVTLTKVYVDVKSGRVHVVDSDSKDSEIPPDKDQVDAANPKIAEHHRTAGRLIDSKVDDGTSYPIPAARDSQNPSYQ